MKKLVAFLLYVLLIVLASIVVMFAAVGIGLHFQEKSVPVSSFTQPVKNSIPAPIPAPIEEKKPVVVPAPIVVPPKDKGQPIKVELISSVDINLKNEPGTVNARVAAKIVDGYVLEPGKIFSFNQKVGERTPDKGFVVGSLPITQDGKEVLIDSVGSGVCRLSVGLATVTEEAGLKQIEITPHEYTPYYFSTNPGLVDATVYWDANIDNKFKNNKDYDIRINCNVDTNSVLHVTYSKLTYK